MRFGPSEHSMPTTFRRLHELEQEIRFQRNGNGLVYDLHFPEACMPAACASSARLSSYFSILFLPPDQGSKQFHQFQ